MAQARTLELIQQPEVDPEVFRIPFVQDLQGQPRRVNDEDARELRWFFGDPQVTALLGASASGASSFGAQLERAALLGYGPMPCRKCGGRWRVRRPRKDSVCVGCTGLVHAGADKCPHCSRPCSADEQDGTGWAPGPRFGKVAYAGALAMYRTEQKLEFRIATISKWPTFNPATGSTGDQARSETIEAFSLRGENVMTEADFREVYPRLPEEECEPCRTCKGSGVVSRARSASHARSRVTAWPTGSSKSGSGTRDDVDALESKVAQGGRMRDGNSSVNLNDLERFTHMQMTLRDAAGIAPLARAALEAFFQPSSTRVGKLTKKSLAATNGRNALKELTPTGSAREIGELEDFMSQVWNLVAWGAQ